MWATRSFHIWNHLKNSLQNQVSPYCPPHFHFSPSHPSNLHLPTYNLSISHQLLIWATRSFQIQIQLGNLFQNQLQLLCPHHFQSHPPIAQILYYSTVTQFISQQPFIWATRSFQIQNQLKKLFQNQLQLSCPPHFQSHPPFPKSSTRPLSLTQYLRNR